MADSVKHLHPPRYFHLDIHFCIITRIVHLVFTDCDAISEQFGPQPDVTAKEDNADGNPEQQTKVQDNVWQEPNIEETAGASNDVKQEEKEKFWSNLDP